MSEGITKELHGWIERVRHGDTRASISELADIAARLEKAFHKAVDEARDTGHREGVAWGRAHAPEHLMDATEEDLAGAGLARLPTDRHGLPWHVGDSVATVGYGGEDGGFRVISFKLFANGVWLMTCANDEHEVLNVLDPSGAAHGTAARPVDADHADKAVSLVRESPVEHPAHYAGDGRIEAMDAMRSMMAPAEDVPPIAAVWWGNAFKYLWRWHLKNGIEDLRKARQCIGYLIAEVGGEG